MASWAECDPVWRRRAMAAAPVLAIGLAGIGVRTPIAMAHPVGSLLLFAWIVTDTMMLGRMAGSAGRLPPGTVLAVLSGACVTVGIGAPPALRDVLLATPAIAGAMIAVVLGHVGCAALRARRLLAGRAGDLRERWVAAASELLPPVLVRLAAAELALLHLALFRWGGPADIPPGCRGFAYHRHLAPMCATLLVLSAIEVAVYHLLLGHWSRTAAVALFVASDVGFLYLVGLIKSFRLRPILLTPQGVRVRAGLLIDRLVPYDAIAKIETGFQSAQIRCPMTLNAALLAWPNILLTLKAPLPRRPLLRRKPPIDRIAFRLDDPEPFVRMLRWRLGSG